MQLFCKAVTSSPVEKRPRPIDSGYHGCIGGLCAIAFSYPEGGGGDKEQSCWGRIRGHGSSLPLILC